MTYLCAKDCSLDSLIMNNQEKFWDPNFISFIQKIGLIKTIKDLVICCLISGDRFDLIEESYIQFDSLKFQKAFYNQFFLFEQKLKMISLNSLLNFLKKPQKQPVTYTEIDAKNIKSTVDSYITYIQPKKISPDVFLRLLLEPRTLANVMLFNKLLKHIINTKEEAIFYLTHSPAIYHRIIIDSLDNLKSIRFVDDFNDCFQRSNFTPDVYKQLFIHWFDLLIGKYPTGSKILNQALKLPVLARNTFLEVAHIQGLILIQFMLVALRSNTQLVYDYFKLSNQVQLDVFISALSKEKNEDILILVKNYCFPELLKLDFINLVGRKTTNGIVFDNIIPSTLIESIKLKQVNNEFYFEIVFNKKQSLNTLGEKSNCFTFKQLPQFVYYPHSNILQLHCKQAEDIIPVTNLLKKITRVEPSFINLISTKIQQQLTLNVDVKKTQGFRNNLLFGTKSTGDEKISCSNDHKLAL